MRAAIYARCSTQDQTVDLQLDGLRDYAKARALEIVTEYVDEGVSGARVKHAALDRLLADAHRRRFDAVLVWKLDRLGRSLSHLIRIVDNVRLAGRRSRLPGRPRARHDQSAWEARLLDHGSGRRVRAGPHPRADAGGDGSGPTTREADRPTPNLRPGVEGPNAPGPRAEPARGRQAAGGGSGDTQEGTGREGSFRSPA